MKDRINLIYSVLSKYWKHLHIAFLVFIGCYQFVKIYILNNRSLSGEYDIVPPPSFFALSLIVMSLACLLFSFVFIKKHRSPVVLFATLVFIYIVLCLGYILQSDSQLLWEGANVPVSNSEIAEEVVQLGPVYILQTWNARTDPYTKEGIYLDAKKKTRDLIERYNLNRFVNIRPDQKKLKVNVNNDRPYQYPPLAPIFMGLWLLLFPFGRWSLVAFTMAAIIICAAILSVYIKNYVKSNSHSYALVFAFFTTPVLIMTYYPSSEHLTMLMVGLSTVIMLWSKKSWGFLRPYVAGALLILASYTKFIIAPYAFLLGIALLISTGRLGWRPFFGYALGVFTVIIGFTFLGYNFWINCILVLFSVADYVAIKPSFLIETISKFLYFGPTILILSFLTVAMCIYGVYEYKERIILVPLLAYLVFFAIAAYKVGFYDRHLISFLLAGSPFMYIAGQKLHLKRGDMAIIPFSNILLLILLMYY